MFRIVVSIVLYFALYVLVAGAGYTDDLWNESEDREYYDCGDWSGVENNKNTNLRSHYYFYSKHRSNQLAMFTRETWGYPDDANFKAVRFSNIAWSCIYIHGFDKTLNVEGTIYTDNPRRINYKTSYLRYRGWSVPSWTVYDVTNTITLSDTGNRVVAKNNITFYGKHANGLKDDYNDVLSTPSDSIEYTRWGAPALTINATITEHRGYSILDIPTPSGVAGIKIEANGGTYEKYSHCLKRNNTTSGFQYYDLIKCEYCTFSGIVPCGVDRYWIDSVPNADISVTLFTPFEVCAAVVDVSVIDSTPDEKNEPIYLKNHSLYALIRFLLPVVLSIWLYRRL